jgi:hypothetical protein
MGFSPEKKAPVAKKTTCVMYTKSVMRSLRCWFGWHTWKMFGGGYTDIRCIRCGIWWDEQ